MYAAILHLRFPPDRRDEVVRFLREEMLPVIRDNPGFLNFQVLDGEAPGELVMVDTWERPDDSIAAGQAPAAVAVHGRFAELELSVAGAGRYTVVVHP
jgi:quinol monooxygenase YgiN